MMPPTSIDGTDITGATIDGTDVQEITVDGQTVFSAGPNLPVAYSNLVAWYPFDSATYGGSNADDVTAIIGGSGDDTAYDGTVNGATYQSSGGVTDINAGANSGAYEFDGSNDFIQVPNLSSSTNRSVTLWVRSDVTGTNQNCLVFSSEPIFTKFNFLNTDELRVQFFDGSFRSMITSITPTQYNHFAIAVDTNTPEVRGYLNGSRFDTISTTASGTLFQDNIIGANRVADPSSSFIDGAIDDVRLYNKALSDAEVSDLYNAGSI